MNYQDYQNSNVKDKTSYFLDSLSPSNRTADYYVNWDKVIDKHNAYFDYLKELNSLLGIENIKEEARSLFLKKPYLLKAIPILIAHRIKNNEQMIVMELDEQYNRSFYSLDFNNIDLNEIDEYLKFIEDTGLFDFLKNSGITNLSDYLYGVEAGMDTNARKNRSGDAMESFIERQVREACERLNYDYRTQLTSKKIKEELGWDINTDRKNRRFDAVIYNCDSNEIYIIETNYFGGGGTKPSSVTGEFTGLDHEIKQSDTSVTFIWVTDGLGWKDGRRALEESFNHIDYIFNMEMLENDYIYEFLKQQ